VLAHNDAQRFTAEVWLKTGDWVKEKDALKRQLNKLRRKQAFFVVKGQD
jgi:nitrogen fixation protein FixH